MKHLTTGLLTLAIVLTGLSTKAQTADEIVDAHLKAIGGKELIGSIKSMSIEGRTQAQGQDFPMTVQTLDGVGSRTDLDIMGNSLIQVYAAKGCWAQRPAMIGGSDSPEDVPEGDCKKSKNRYTIASSLLNYKEKGKTVTLKGKESVNGAECYVLEVSSADGDNSKLFIDAKTYYIVKTSAKITAPDGQEVEVESTYSDFKPEGGYVMAHQREVVQMGYPTVVIFDKVEINKAVDEKIFDKPKN